MLVPVPALDRRRLLRWVTFFDVAVCVTSARPLAPFLLAAVALWIGLGHHRVQLVAKTARDLAAPLWTGITLLCAALVGLNVFRDAASPSQVHGTEEWLARVQLQLDEWTHLSPLWRLGIGLIVLALAVVVPAARPATRFARAHGRIAFTKRLLLVLTSFTVFAGVPLQADVQRVYSRIATDYQGGLAREWRADAATAATETLSAPEWRPALDVLRTKAEAPGFDRAAVAAQIKSDFQTQENALDREARLRTSTVLGSQPSTTAELDELERRAAARTESADRAERRELETGATDFLSTLATFLPSWSGPGGEIAATFIGHAVDAAAGHAVAAAFAETARDGRPLAQIELSGAELATIARGPAIQKLRSRLPSRFEHEVARASRRQLVIDRGFTRTDHGSSVFDRFRDRVDFLREIVR